MGLGGRGALGGQVRKLAAIVGKHIVVEVQLDAFGA